MPLNDNRRDAISRVRRSRKSPLRWSGSISAVSFVFLIGCGNQPPAIDPNSTDQVAAETGVTADRAAKLDTSDRLVADPANRLVDQTNSGPLQTGNPGGTPQPLSVAASESGVRPLQLRSDLSVPETVSLLGEIDREMRALINGQSGITDPNALRSEVERVVELKRIASERLMNDPRSDGASRVKGNRGYLQAMSHLASMGDLAAAEELQLFADKFREHPNAELRSDSQLVLIGFAIENLRHGKNDAAERVLNLTKGIAESENPVDVATLMVMGQAKDTLLQYERIEEAAEVRELILQRFAGADDPEVARMAAMIAASGFTDNDEDLQRLDSLRTAIVQPETGSQKVTASMWTAAVEKVLDKDIDLLTIQFLAGMSLEAEAIGRDDIAQATYKLLSTNIVDREDAIGREARTAIQAKMNREAVIGQKFDPDLPSVDGQSLSMTAYDGKVVLIPFWSSAFPDSLAVLPNLQAIEERYPDKVKIVGVNLDLADTDARGFMDQNGLDFRSFRSVSDPSAEITNEVAYRFGAVSLLFVAVLDPTGRVAFVDFSGSDLTEKVEKLIR